MLMLFIASLTFLTMVINLPIILPSKFNQSVSLVTQKTIDPESLAL